VNTKPALFCKVVGSAAELFMNQDFYNSEILLLLEARHQAFGICAAITPSNPEPRRGAATLRRNLMSQTTAGPGKLIDRNARVMHNGAN
jgi:hypothetical protein